MIADSDSLCKASCRLVARLHMYAFCCPRLQDPFFITSGTTDTDPNLKVMNFMTNSLFDPGGPENSGEPSELIFDQEKHQQTYTETYGLCKYGAFWMDYLFMMEPPENPPGAYQDNDIMHKFIE